MPRMWAGTQITRRTDLAHESQTPVNPKRTIWTVIFGASMLTGYRALTTQSDPIPQLAGIGAAGIMLLFLAEPAPKLASGFAVLMAITLALNWDIQPRIRGGGTRT